VTRFEFARFESVIADRARCHERRAEGFHPAANGGSAQRVLARARRYRRARARALVWPSNEGPCGPERRAQLPRRREAGVTGNQRAGVLTTFAIAALLLLSSTRASAGGSVVVTITDGRKAKADITLPNPNGGNYTAEFEIEFERDGLQNLTVECLGLTADVLDAAEQADVNGRLPHATHQQVDTAFPVRVTVEPPPACGLTFRNGYDVTFETDDLVYQPNSVYRLFKAPIGGLFHYVTGSVTQGSVRSRGRTGAFSEFVIAKDTSPNFPADCNDEYETLGQRIATATMSPTARRTLEVDLERSRAAYIGGNYAVAIDLLAAFDAHCVEFGGDGLPNQWRSTRDLDNVEGDMVGHTDNLRFMMGRLNGSP
jgi:hypothetical protein